MQPSPNFKKYWNSKNTVVSHIIGYGIQYQNPCIIYYCGPLHKHIQFEMAEGDFNLIPFWRQGPVDLLKLF